MISLLMIFSIFEKIPTGYLDFPTDDFFDSRKNTYPMSNNVFVILSASGGQPSLT